MLINDTRSRAISLSRVLWKIYRQQQEYALNQAVKDLFLHTILMAETTNCVPTAVPGMQHQCLHVGKSGRDIARPLRAITVDRKYYTLCPYYLDQIKLHKNVGNYRNYPK
jgi:hypothetical protein